MPRRLDTPEPGTLDEYLLPCAPEVDEPELDRVAPVLNHLEALRIERLVLERTLVRERFREPRRLAARAALERAIAREQLPLHADVDLLI